MTVPPPVVMVVCSPNVLPSKRGFHPGRRGNSSWLFTSFPLHLRERQRDLGGFFSPRVFRFTCCLGGFIRHCVFVDVASMQADVSSNVSECRAVWTTRLVGDRQDFYKSGRRPLQ